MRIGTRNYFADISSKGVGIFVYGIKKNFYPWGAGKDEEAREIANEALDGVANCVKKHATEEQEAGLFLRSMNVGANQYPGWRVKTDLNSNVISFAALGKDGYNGSQVSFSTNYENESAYFHIRSVDGNSQISGNSNTNTCEFVVKKPNNHVKLYSNDTATYVELSHNHDSGTRSFIRLQNNADANVNKFYLETEYKPDNENDIKMRWYFDLMLMRLTKNGVVKDIDLWDLADLLINSGE